MVALYEVLAVQKCRHRSKGHSAVISKKNESVVIINDLFDFDAGIQTSKWPRLCVGFAWTTPKMTKWDQHDWMAWKFCFSLGSSWSFSKLCSHFVKNKIGHSASADDLWEWPNLSRWDLYVIARWTTGIIVWRKLAIDIYESRASRWSCFWLGTTENPTSRRRRLSGRRSTTVDGRWKCDVFVLEKYNQPAPLL